ncbi:MAG: hypothetical protein Q9208_004224 [Pyrenodesmia sp. 3 TL-2023]
MALYRSSKSHRSTREQRARQNKAPTSARPFIVHKKLCPHKAIVLYTSIYHPQCALTFILETHIMFREDWTAGCEAVQKGLQFKVYTSGALHTSEMPLRTKIKGIMTLAKTTRNDGKEDHVQRPLIRHQNPRLNAPGVPPAPALLPPFAALEPLTTKAKPRILPGKAAALTEATNSGHRSTKQSPQKPTQKSLKGGKVSAKGQVVSREATPRAPSPKIKFNAQKALPTTHLSRISLIPQPIPAHKTSTSSLRSTASITPSPKPRIAYRRMTLLCRLGSGGEGHCDLFRLHTPPTLLLAVKTLTRTPTLITPSSTNRRPKPLEAHILQDLLPPHPRIAHLHDYTHRTLQTRFFFEYCPLGDLQDIIDSHFKRRVRVPEGFLWHVFSQLAEAVHHLHTAARDGKGKHITILHRDIKPGNVLLRPSSSSSCSKYPDIILTDFGCATPHLPPDPPTTTASVVGSLTYQGPELPLQNSLSDIWSLGATIHALAHGYPPMCLISPNTAYETWEWDPDSRVVEDVTAKGYSGCLQSVLTECCMRGRWWKRLDSAELLARLRAEMGRRAVGGGKERGLEEWACGGGGMEKEVEVQEWEVGRV